MTDKPFHVAFDELIKQKKLSFRQLEYLTGLSKTYLGFLKNHPDQYPPTKDNIEATAKVLEVSPYYFREYRTMVAQEEIGHDQALADIIAGNKLVKIIGYAPASSMKEAIEMELGVAPTNNIDADFAIIARGNCLTGAGINDGDVILMKRKEARVNDIILARYDGEVTLKRFVPHNDKIELRPENPEYQPIIISNFELSDFEVLGIAVGKAVVSRL